MRMLSPWFLISPYGVFPPTIGPPQRLVCAFEGTYECDDENTIAAPGEQGTEEDEDLFATPGFGGVPAVAVAASRTACAVPTAASVDRAWHPIEYKYMTSSAADGGVVVAPHHPRLDHRVFYHALGMSGKDVHRSLKMGWPYSDFSSRCAGACVCVALPLGVPLQMCYSHLRTYPPPPPPPHCSCTILVRTALRLLDPHSPVHHDLFHDTLDRTAPPKSTTISTFLCAIVSRVVSIAATIACCLSCGCLCERRRRCFAGEDPRGALLGVRVVVYVYTPSAVGTWGRAGWVRSDVLTVVPPIILSESPAVMAADLAGGDAANALWQEHCGEEDGMWLPPPFAFRLNDLVWRRETVAVNSAPSKAAEHTLFNAIAALRFDTPDETLLLREVIMSAVNLSEGEDVQSATKSDGTGSASATLLPTFAALLDSGTRSLRLATGDGGRSIAERQRNETLLYRTLTYVARRHELGVRAAWPSLPLYDVEKGTLWCTPPASSPNLDTDRLIVSDAHPLHYHFSPPPPPPLSFFSTRWSFVLQWRSSSSRRASTKLSVLVASGHALSS